MKRTHGKSLWGVLGVVAMFGWVVTAGCYYEPTIGVDLPGTDEANDVTAQTYVGKIYQVGTLTGALADELAAQLDLTDYDGTSSDGPILIAADALEDLTDDEIAAIKAAYEARHPVMLFGPTREQVLALFEMLGVDRDFVMPENVETAEVLAIDLEEDGNMFQWAQYAPDIDANAGETDAEDEQISRANMLVKWIDDNEERMQAVDVVNAKEHARAAALDTHDLTQLAAAFIDQSNFSQYGNNYQISHYIWGCHSYDTGDDWFYVQQQGVMYGGGAYKGKFDWYQGNFGDMAYWYMDNIEMDSSMVGCDWATTKLGMMQATPETVNNVTTVTSGISWNIGGTVGVSKDGPAAEITGGVTIENSKSVSVSDCQVLNKCNDRGNNAHWLYQFNRCSSVAYFLYAGVTDPPNLSITTFQPLNQWVWRANNSLRAGSTKMHVKLTVGLVATGGVVDFYWAAHPSHQTMAGGSWEYDVSMPYPKLLQ